MRAQFLSNTDGRVQLKLEADPGAESLLFHHWLKEMRAGDLPITVMHLGGSNETGQHFTIGCYPPHVPVEQPTKRLLVITQDAWRFAKYLRELGLPRCNALSLTPSVSADKARGLSVATTAIVLEGDVRLSVEHHAVLDRYRGMGMKSFSIDDIDGCRAWFKGAL